MAEVEKVKKSRRRFGRAERVIEYIENLTIPSGEGQGSFFVLEDFQRDFIKDIYAEHNILGRGWTRRVRRGILSIARKNGKTALIAALVLVHLHGPEAIYNGEIYSAANNKDQAAQVYKFIFQMIDLDEDLAEDLVVVDSKKTITCPQFASSFTVLSKDAKTKHGSSPSVWIYDELAQSKDRELFDTLDTSQGGRYEPLGLVISTQSNDPLHPLSEMIDDALTGVDPDIVAHIYTVPEDQKNIFDPKCWKLANPALGVFRSLVDFESMARKAKRLKSFEAAFRNLYLNQRVSTFTTLFAKSVWMERKGAADLYEGEDVLLSLDLSGRHDLTALGIISLDEGARYQTYFWKPEAYLDDHSKRDKVPYRTWHDQGLLNVSPGEIVDPASVALFIGEIMQVFNVRGLVYDRWNIDYLIKDLDRADIAAKVYKDTEKDEPYNGLLLYPWGQGFVSMGPAITALENLVLTNQLEHDGHPILTWNVANAVIDTDPAGNRKFDKSKTHLRIDGAQALAMAAGMREKLAPVDPSTSVYEERGVLLA